MAFDEGLRERSADLLVREGPALRRMMLRYVRDESTVDDMYQEVSLKVMRRLHTVRDERTIRGWLFQIARNACLFSCKAASWPTMKNVIFRSWRANTSRMRGTTTSR